MRIRLLVFAVACSFVVPVWAQRLVGVFDPQGVEPGLIFDVNDRPVRQVDQADLNFSPNVVFSPDSTRAFVSFSGSDRVGVFNPKTGQLIALVPVGANPGQLTVTPDQREVAVASLSLEANIPDTETGFVGERIGSISLIDIETLAVRRMELEEVFFSLANNIAFSQQGDRVFGFIGSAGTDQILRFDLGSATEVLPRIDFETGTRPSSISMAQDGSFFAAVLVGSTTLAARETPDSVEIIDAASFTLRRSIVPEAELNSPSHDFRAVNNVALSADGKYGLIGDQEFSALLNIPGVADDHALFFNVESGEVEEILAVGGGAGVCSLSPDGSTFALVSAFKINLIDVATREVQFAVPPQSDFKPSTRPVFSLHQELMFVAAPLDDAIVTINWKTGQVDRVVLIGGVVEREVSNVPVQVSSAPLDLAITPDGKTLTAVHFNANTVELLVETQTSFLPLALATSTWFTGIAVTNASDQPAGIIATGRDRTSVLFRDKDPENPSITNPVRICRGVLQEVDGDCQLGPGEQAIFTFGQLTNPPPGETLQGWLEFASDQWNLIGAFLMGDRKLRRLDGFAGGQQGVPEVVISEVRITDGFETELALLNPNIGVNNITLKLVDFQGNDVDEQRRTLFSNVLMIALVKDIFPTEVLENFEGGYLVAEGSAPLFGVVRYFDQERLAAVAAFPVRPESYQATRLFAPQVVAFGGSQTQLTLIHMGSETLTANLTLKGNQGQNLADPATISLSLDPKQGLRRSVRELFDLADPGGLVSGWIIIETDRAGLLGTVEVSSGRAMTTVPLQGANRDFLFPYIANQQNVSTGLAVINSDSESADIQLEVFGADAQLMASRTLTLPPNHREIKGLHEFFPALPAFVGGVVRFSSDREVVALELLYQNQLEYLSAIPVQVVDPAKGGAF